MTNKLLTASGAFATSGANRRVNRVTFGATDASSVTLRSGGSSGTIVWASYAPANQSVQFYVPNIMADYATITGTSPNVIIEFSSGS